MSLFRALPDGLEIRYRHEVIHVQAWGANSLRVRAAIHTISTADHGALDEPLGASTCSVVIDGDSAEVTHGKIRAVARLDRSEAIPEVHLAFFDATTGKELLREERQHFWAPGARVHLGDRAGDYELHQQFAAYDDELLFGMGQRTHGRLNLKGLGLDLIQRNGEVNIPFVLSNRGYGFLWNLPAIGRVEFGVNATRWQAGQGRQIDYWITAGDTPAAILASYADATGHVPELPAWASGFWQSKLRYRTQEELLEVAREFARRDLPLSVIVSDYFHWSAMGDYRFDPAEWPDPKAMVDELRDLGVELMVSVWPTVSPLSENYQEFRDAGLLVGSDQGIDAHQTSRDKGMAVPMAVSFYDPTNPATREYVWELIRKNYVAHGIGVWWLDACEPELNPPHPANLSFFAGPGAQVANIYPRDNARLFAEGMASEGLPQTVLFSRSAWAGSQKYGAAVWSGDIAATWDSLRTQVRAGLSIALSGIPWWTTDIGGFHGGDPSDPAYQELIIRWFQFGVFCPLFRLHGDREPRNSHGYAASGGPNEPWSYGETAYEIIAEIIRLRERLRPYIHEQMQLAAATGLPPMRPLFVDSSGDQVAWGIDDEFMFGPDILVAPVLQAGATSRAVYLPAGTKWTDAWTGESLAGGSTVTVDAPIERIPVFTRGDATLPLRASVSVTAVADSVSRANQVKSGLAPTARRTSTRGGTHDCPAQGFVRCRQADGVATVGLVNAKSMNILGSEAIEELTAEFRRLSREDGCRVVVLRGAGDEAFIGGADINEMAGLDQTGGEAFISRLAALCEAVRACPAPVIARLSGWCLGAGLEVAVSCDLRVAGTGAAFGMPEVAVGIPSVIHAALIPAMIGASRAAWLLLTGETIDAGTAANWGLVHDVVPDDELDARIAQLAARMTALGPEAVRQQKRLLNEWIDMTTRRAIEDSITQFGLAFLTGEPQHYMARFMERQAARRQQPP